VGFSTGIHNNTTAINLTKWDISAMLVNGTAFRDLSIAEVYNKDGGRLGGERERNRGNKCCVVVAGILRLNLINLPHNQSALPFETRAPQKLFQLPLQRGDPQTQQ
jgi:hypothetical protein